VAFLRRSLFYEHGFGASENLQGTPGIFIGGLQLERAVVTAVKETGPLMSLQTSSPGSEERLLYNQLAEFLAADSWEELRVVINSYPSLLSPTFLYLIYGAHPTTTAERKTISHRIQFLAVVDRLGLEGALAGTGEIPHCEVGMEVPEQIGRLYQEANATESEYHLVGDLALLDRVVALRAAIIDHPQFELASLRVQYEMLNDHAVAFRHRYDAVGNREDMWNALKISKQLVEICPTGRKRYPAFLSGLGNSFQDKFDLLGDLTDLNEAKSCYERAIALSPRSAACLNNLGNVLGKRFNHLGNADDLDQAIVFNRRALELTPAGDSGRPLLLHNLGGRLSDRFALNGSLRDLNEAIEVERESVALISPTSRAIPGYLNNLVISLNRRYEASGSIDDLNEAIDLQSRAVSLNKATSPDHPSYLNVLGLSLQRRFKEFGRSEDLDRAISAQETAVSLLDPKSPRLASLAHNLATSLKLRGNNEPAEEKDKTLARFRVLVSKLFSRKKGMKASVTTSLDRAIDLDQRAIRASAANAPELPDYYVSLADGLHRRYMKSKSVDDLKHARETLEQATTLMREDHPRLPSVFLQLAEWGPADLDVTAYYRAACEKGMQVNQGVAKEAGIRWGKRCMLLQKWPEASEAYGYAIQAIKNISETQLFRKNKEHWLQGCQGIAEDAAYAAVQCGEVEKAVLALESGRAILISEMLDEADPREVQLLRLGRTDLVQRLKVVRERLLWLRSNPSLEAPAEFEGVSNVIHNMRSARTELNSTLTAVSEVLGTPSSALTFRKLTKLSQEFPLLYLVMTENAGLAILLDFSNQPSPTIVPLPALSRKAVREILQGDDDDRLLGGYLGKYLSWRREPADYRSFQRWLQVLDETTSRLWKAIAEPLEPLFAQLQEREVTFIVSGMLALLPLHASWTYDGGSPNQRKHLPFLIRYSATARLLLSSRERLEGAKGEEILIVDDPQPTSAGKLPFSPLESLVATNHFKKAVRLQGAAASRDSVIKLLSDSDVCHFSCHAYAQINDPLRSGMLMANGEILTLKDILGLNLSIRMVVLSACESAVFGTSLPDEIISLATGFLQSGVATTIASLWAATELNTFLVLARFYERWKTDGLTSLRALYDAQTWLRDTDNGTKCDFLDQMRQKASPNSQEYRLLYDAEKNLKQLGLREHTFRHPFFWAHFCHFGV
jgi:CHAT domain-containing protein/tetratricopeptide (TPR) repeat protein